MAISLEQARARRLGWGTTALVSGAVLVSSLGAEGLFGIITGGLGLIPEAAAAPELIGWDAFWGFLFITAVNRAFHYNSLYNHLKGGGTHESHTYNPPLKHPTYGSRR